MKLNKKNQQSGVILIISILILAIVTTLASAIVGYTTLQIKGERQSLQQGQALALAEAGIDKAIDTINTNPSYTGETATPLGNGVFTVVITSIDGNNKQITSTGYIPNATSPTATKIVKANMDLNTTAIAFNFGVQVGEGGITMNNGSRIKGNIFSNGSITGSGTIEGSATVGGGTPPMANQFWNTQNASLLLGNISARADIAQSFVPTSTLPVNKVSAYLRKLGSPADIAVKILTDNSGVPSKTVVASATIPAASVTSTYGFVDANFSTPPTLTAGTTYWIMLAANVDGTNYYDWGEDNTSGYSSGTGKYSTNWNATTPVWNDAGGDLDFQVWMGGVDTMISGVTVGGTAKAHTLTGCTISGNAYYYFTNTCTVGGVSNSNQADTPAAPMPVSPAQISSWEDSAVAGGTISGSYTVSGNVSLGPKKIDGDLVINGTLNMTGPIWVVGNITFGIGSNVTMDASLGNAGVALVADNPGNMLGSGIVSVNNNTTFAGNGNPNSYPLIVTTNTSDNAISLNNNASGAVFFAQGGTIAVGNNVDATQLTGYKIKLNNNAIITYATGLASADFSDGPGGSWQFTPGTYVITK